MNIAALKLSLILLGLSWLLKFQAWRHPKYRERLKEKNLTAQFIARDEEIGRWFQFEDGRITSGGGVLRGRRRHGRLQERRGRRRPPDAADQLARPDQRAEGIPADRRRRGRPRQLVRADRDDGAVGRLQARHQDAGRLDALLQHDERRAGVRHCAGRQDRAHDADRLRRQRPAALDHRGEGPEAHAAAQDDAGAAWPKRQVDRLFARSSALSDEARRLRSERRAQSAEPRQVRLRPHLVGRGADDRLQRDQAAEARARPRRHRGVAWLAPHLGQHRLLPVGAVPLHQRGRHDARPPQSRIHGRAGTGARCITGATRCASASRRLTARSKTVCRTAT